MPKRKRWPTLVFAVPIYGHRCALLGLADTHPDLRLWMELHKHYTLYWIADVYGCKQRVALTIAGAARRYKRQEAKKK